MGKKVIKKQKRWVTLKRVGKEKRYYLKLTKKALKKLKKQLHRKGRVGITVTARMRSVDGQPRRQAPHRHAHVQEGRARQACTVALTRREACARACSGHPKGIWRVRRLRRNRRRATGFRVS